MDMKKKITSPFTFYGEAYEVNYDTMASFKNAAKPSFKNFAYKRGKSMEGATDASEDDSEKSSNASSKSSRPKGLNRQKSFTEATKRGLRRLSNAFKAGNESGDEDEDRYVKPSIVASSNLTSEDVASTSATAGAHPRSATVGMYVTPPTLERGAGGLHEILNAKKSLRKSQSNKRW
jgi:hypothetical protein